VWTGSEEFLTFLFISNNLTRYSSRFAPINDAIVPLAGFKANENKPNTILLTFYGPRNQLEKVASI
jgi:hypothetical protein